MFKRTTTMAILASLSFSTVAGNGPTSKCRVINWKEDQVYNVRAALHKATHIVLPENMLGGKPIPGDSDLWTIEGQRNHIFLKPNNWGNAEGRESTVHAIGSDTNESYAFVISRVKSNPDVCVKIKRTGNLLSGVDLSSYRSPNDRLIDVQNQQIMHLKNQVSASDEKAITTADHALSKYRQHIFTRYNWKHDGWFGSDWFGEDVISDVYDDGRFTFIRLYNDNKGVLAVTAEIDGEDEMIEYRYNEATKVYKLSGIFPVLHLAYGEADLVVERSNNSTTGGY